MYQNAVNDIMCHPDDKPTIGLLLVKGKNKTVVEYSLAGYQNPIGVAEWKNQMVNALPEELKSSLPSIEEIEKELEQHKLNDREVKNEHYVPQRYLKHFAKGENFFEIGNKK